MADNEPPPHWDRFTADVTQPAWEPDRRDSELRRIKGLTTAITVAAVGLAGAFTAGIAWADRKMTTQSGGSSDSQSTGATTPAPGVSPPASTPKSSSGSQTKTKSGGS